MAYSIELRNRYLFSFIHAAFEPGRALAAVGESHAYSYLAHKGVHKDKRVINWSQLFREAASPQSAPMFLLLLAVTFSDSIAEDSPYLSQCLNAYTNNLLFPDFPKTWSAAYRSVAYVETTEQEELSWREVDRLVSKFFLAIQNSRKLRQTLIRRFELAIKDVMWSPASITALRKEGLLGKEDDRVTVFDLTRFGHLRTLTVEEKLSWPLTKEVTPAVLPEPTKGQEWLDFYNGCYRGLFLFENYVIFNLPLLTYDVLVTNRSWSMLPKQAYGKCSFSSAQDFANHYITFRDTLHNEFDKTSNDLNEDAKKGVLARWCAQKLPSISMDDSIATALLNLATDPERASRFRVVNGSDLRSRITMLLNRTYIKAPKEKRDARKATLTKERTITLALPENVRHYFQGHSTVGITARRATFYIEAGVLPPFTQDQTAYFNSRVKTYAPYISVGETHFVSLAHLSNCYDIGLRTYPDLAWIKPLVDSVHNTLSDSGIASIEDWATAYKERLASSKPSTGDARHTTFTKEDDALLWSKWKRYMHEAAREEALSLFPQYNQRHLILRGRLMSQIRRANKPIEFLYDTEGLKKFLGKQYPTYSAVID